MNTYAFSQHFHMNMLCYKISHEVLLDPLELLPASNPLAEVQHSQQKTGVRNFKGNVMLNAQEVDCVIL